MYHHFPIPIVVVAVLTGAGLAAAPVTSAAAGGTGWTSSVFFSNQVASSPTSGGGYPVPPGQTFPNPGALLYPGRPASAETLAMIEAVAGEQAVQVTWYDDVDWHL